MNLLKFAIGMGVALAPCAMADLVLNSTQQSTGNGLGAVTTILTVQSPGNSTAEAGCISSTGVNTGCQNNNFNFTYGQTQTGNSQTQLVPLPSITSASQLIFNFNASQPAGSSITLQEMNILFYTVTNGNFTLLDAATYTGPTVLTSTFTGVGNAGFQFSLNPAEQATINGALGQNIMVGASLVAGCGANGLATCNGTTQFGATGGHDVIQIAVGPGTTSTVPEPATYGLIGAGLGLLGFARKFRKA